jgi:hypothetical protein
MLGKIKFVPWQAYTLLSLLVTAALFLLSMWTVKPNPLGRLRIFLKREEQEQQKDKVTATA